MSGLSKIKTGGLHTGCVSADAIATGAVTVADIPDGEITYAKMQNVSATDRLLGRDTAGAGDVEEITPAKAEKAAEAVFTTKAGKEKLF